MTDSANFASIADEAIAALPDKSLMVLDDDAPLRTRLGRALEARGFVVTLVGSIAEALEALRASPPAFAVLDMRLEDGNGLKVVEALREQRPDSRAVMLTGYGAIATAVAAVKAGAADYLSKPADADDVVKELDAADKRMLVVLNKIDLVPDPAKRREIAEYFTDPVLLSVHTGEGMENFMNRVADLMLDRSVKLHLRLPQTRMDLVAMIHREGKLIHQEYDGNDILLTTTIPRRWEGKFLEYVVVPENKPAKPAKSKKRLK